MTKKEKLQQLNKQAYASIATSFNASRVDPWEEMRELASDVHDGDKVIDLGCGNGRLLKALPEVNFEYLGIDSTSVLIDYARKAFPNREFTVQSFEQLSLPASYYDFVFCIASFHHVVGAEDRMRFLTQCYTTLKPGGKLMMTVWNLWQLKYISYIMKFPATKVDWNDFFIPWKRQQPVIWRYYHGFTKGELQRLFRRAGFTSITVDKVRNNYIIKARV